MYEREQNILQAIFNSCEEQQLRERESERALLYPRCADLFMETSVFRMEASCLELALEGERLCKAGDFKGGTAFFEAAVQVGTEDLKTLSAIYSQLGNAYFYLKEYGKALEYHRHDLTLARWVSNCGNKSEGGGVFERDTGGIFSYQSSAPLL